MTWNPIIVEPIMRARVDEKIGLIIHELERTEIQGPGLYGGASGVSLFWQYCSLYTNQQRHKLLARSSIESALKSVQNMPLRYDFSSGVAGILWAITHLSKEGHIDWNLTENIGTDIHEFLLKSSTEDFNKGEYDYMHAGLSTLPYFVERSDNLECRDSIIEIVNLLEHIAHLFPEGIAWQEASEFLINDIRRYNLGMAHGIPGIIVLMCKIWQQNIDRIRVGGLIEKSINYILDKERRSYGSSLFPSTYPSDGIYNSRVAWCYGDLGIAVALFQAGQILGNKMWQNKAVDIALHTCNRKQEQGRVRDTPICHGTSGNAHLFNRMFQYTGKPEFRSAALYWYDETLNMHDQLGHFRHLVTYKEGDKAVFEYQIGLLEGIAGVGLSLIAGVSEVEPKWDKCFLIS